MKRCTFFLSKEIVRGAQIAELARMQASLSLYTPHESGWINIDLEEVHLDSENRVTFKGRVPRKGTRGFRSKEGKNFRGVVDILTGTVDLYPTL